MWEKRFKFSPNNGSKFNTHNAKVQQLADESSIVASEVLNTHDMTVKLLKKKGFSLTRLYKNNTLFFLKSGNRRVDFFRNTGCFFTEINRCVLLLLFDDISNEIGKVAEKFLLFVVNGRIFVLLHWLFIENNIKRTISYAYA